MEKETAYVVFDKRETLAESILKDLTTFAVVFLLVYVSRGSSWWTLVTGFMFIFIAFGKIASVAKKRHHVFKTKADLQNWVNKLPDDARDTCNTSSN